MVTARKTVVLGLIGACVVQACTAHVRLPRAPERGAPFAERLAFYRQHRPGPVRSAVSVSLGWAGDLNPIPLNDETLVLANGTVVHDPMDLARMVGTDSAVGVSARRAQSRQSVAQALVWSGGAALVLGTVLALVGLTSGNVDRGMTTMFVGLGFSVVGGLAVPIGRAVSSAASSERQAAFDGLDGTLRTRLGLCDDGQALRDCNAPPPESPLLGPPLTTAGRLRPSAADLLRPVSWTVE